MLLRQPTQPRLTGFSIGLKAVFLIKAGVGGTGSESQGSF